MDDDQTKRDAIPSVAAATSRRPSSAIEVVVVFGTRAIIEPASILRHVLLILFLGFSARLAADCLHFLVIVFSLFSFHFIS